MAKEWPDGDTRSPEEILRERENKKPKEDVQKQREDRKDRRK